MALSRRAFLKSSFGSSVVMSLGPTVPMFLARAALAGTGGKRRDTVLVVVQLSGGNDGLNTVVPYADDVYARARNTLRLTGRDVIKIDDHLGFHPRMKGFARLLKEGRLSVVHGVGYPNSDRGHDGAMRNWHTGRPDQPQCPTGWVGRAVDGASRGDEPDLPGVFVGPIKQPFAMAAQKSVVPSITSTSQFTLDTMPGPAGAAHQRQLLQAAERASDNDDNPLADYLRRSALTARATSQQSEVVLADAARPGAYPSFGLARNLQTVAELIRADVGVRIFFVELGGGGIGGFDNHANQKGNHDAMLQQLSDSVAAFVDDMSHHRCLDRVMLMTFSEFGRTLTENGRHGTGHGAAQPIFLAGGRLRGGLIGKHPSLTDLDNDAQKHHTDFRSVYASVLEDWLGLDSDPALGGKFKPVNVFAKG